MTHPFDFHQQLYTYLQAWRQLVETLTAMSNPAPYAGMPWAMPPMPPYMPPAPPIPPVPPATSPSPPVPTDYTQQLVSALQSWRQYLEQMSGAQPVPGPPSPSSPAEGGSAHETPPPGRPSGTVPVEPDRYDAARTSYTSIYGVTSRPPELIALAPRDQGGNQVPDDLAYGLRSTPRSGRPDRDVDRAGPGALSTRGQGVVSGTAGAAMPRPPDPRGSATARDVVSRRPMPAARESLFKGLVDRTNTLGGG